MDDDFNTPRAIATLFDLSREVNTLLNSDKPVSRATLEAIDGLYRTLGGDVLGILFDDGTGPGARPRPIMTLVDGLVRMLDRHAPGGPPGPRMGQGRRHPRPARSEMGIALEDGPEGTRWRLEPVEERMREILYGRQPVRETLRAGRRQVFKLLLAREFKTTGHRGRDPRPG